MKAELLYKVGSSPAPKEWEDLPEIAKAKPDMKDVDRVCLTQITGTNVCQWMVKHTHLWSPASEYFLVGEEEE